MSPQKIGVIINNIGTPREPHFFAVGSYLREFLMDPKVLSLPFILRAILVYLIIVPFRARRSSAKYRKIWKAEGSPLAVYSRLFADHLQVELGDQFCVELGMSYGSPSIAEALANLSARNISRLIFWPMFPQWSEATTESACSALRGHHDAATMRIQVAPAFHHENFFLLSLSAMIQSEYQQSKSEYLLFSYHSLPVSQVAKQTGCLTTSDCCDQVGACEKPCYRAQCLQTTNQLARTMNLPVGSYSTSFQSRLGRRAWLGPATVTEVERLARQGVRRLAVVSPSFVADCLETLEELAIETKARFLACGGEQFHYIPCLNDDPVWVAGCASYVRRQVASLDTYRA
ncbi:MAG: ferrochelatase [Bdellovibrio sp.]|nr:MAG: ferrochelatase [Bdellovibrio sp.]